MSRGPPASHLISIAPMVSLCVVGVTSRAEASVQEILDMYARELCVKRVVALRALRVADVRQLTTFLSSWALQPYVDSGRVDRLLDACCSWPDLAPAQGGPLD